MYYQFPFKIGWCSICDQGWAQIQKFVQKNEFLIICSECEAVWKTPDDFLNDNPVQSPVVVELAQTPTVDEVIALGWRKYLLDREGDLRAEFDD